MRIKDNLFIWMGVSACLLLAALSYFGATRMIDSLFAYRSPLHSQPPSPGKALGQPLTRRVVVVLIDALREDTSQDAAVMPFLNELRQKGAWATMHSRPPSYSEPGYSVLFTGAWPDISDGPTINVDYAQIPTWTQDDLFSSAHRAGLNTAVSGYYWFEKLIPQEVVSTSFYTPGEDQAADRQVVDAALPWLTKPDYALVLIHIDQVDYAGHHEGGPRDPRWNEAAHRADNLLAEIASKLDLNQDTLLVVSDHGQIDQGGHGGQDPITLLEPFILVGAGIKPGAYGDVFMVDVAPTLAALLGTNIPASSQGHVRTEMLNLSESQMAGIESALVSQQSQLSNLYQTAIGNHVTPQPASDIVDEYQNAMDQARQSRVNSERIPRGILAGLVIILIILLIIVNPSTDLVWFLLGGVIYLAIFNLRYSVIDGKSYSLSSVGSATDLILYTATNTLIAFLIAWLVITFISKAWQRTSIQAARFTFGFVFITIFILGLPVLWNFFINGAFVTWVLPDFAVNFLAFLSMLQILFVSIFGMIFAGISALVSRWLNHTKEDRNLVTL